jgi:cysteine desulfurase / selenocysteine lyase
MVSGDPGVLFPFTAQALYLNTAAVGLTSQHQANSAAAYQGVALREAPNYRESCPTWLDAARSRLSSLLGVRDDRLYFTGSTTEGLNIAALGLPLRAGDRVVVAEDEFPSVLQPWLQSKRRGLVVERVPIREERQRTEALVTALQPRARVLAVSHVHWRTGTRVDLAQLRDACHRHDTWLIVDGAQAVGTVPVNAALADVYCGTSCKWLLAGFGVGFVTLSDRLIDAWTPPLFGYGRQAAHGSPEYGPLNYPGIHALNASLELLDSIGWPAIHQRVAALTARLLATLPEEEFPIVTPADARGGIVSFQHPCAAALVGALKAKSIYVADRGSLVRVSPHFYNSEADIDRFVVTLHRSLSVVATRPNPTF